MLKLTLSSVSFRDFVPGSATDLGGEGGVEGVHEQQDFLFFCNFY